MNSIAKGLEIKAKEFAEELKKSDEYKKLQSVRIDVFGDPDGKKLMKRVEKIQTRVFQTGQQGKSFTPEELEEMKQLYGEMEKMPLMKKMMTAQMEFNFLYQKLSEIIYKTLFY